MEKIDVMLLCEKRVRLERMGEPVPEHLIKATKSLSGFDGIDYGGKQTVRDLAEMLVGKIYA